MPWSFSCQRRGGGVGAGGEEPPGVVGRASPSWSASRCAAPSSSPYTSSCRWFQAPLPTRTGRLSRQPGQVRQLALGQVVLAADAEHDLQVRRRAAAETRPRSAMKSKNSSASSGQAATHSASIVKLASRTQE